MPDVIQDQRALEIATLAQQIEDVNAQIRFTSDLVERGGLERKRDYLENKYRTALQAFADTRQTPRQRGLDWNACLHKLDYKEVRELAEQIEFDLTIGAASFFLQNGRDMGGKWCLATLHEMFEVDKGKLPAYRVEFGGASNLSEASLVHAFKKAVERSPGSGSAQPIDDAKALIGCLCEQLATGCVLFLELAFDETLAQKPEFLRWLLDGFWNPLLERARQTSHSRELSLIKIILVVAVDAAVFDDSTPLAEACRSFHDCDPRGLQPLELRFWTRQEVFRWLTGPANLADRGKERIESIIRYSWKEDRCPDDVGGRLLSKLNDL